LNETIETSTDRLKHIKSTLDDFKEKINMSDTGEQKNQTDRPQASKPPSRFDVFTSTIAYKKEREGVQEMINASRRAEIDKSLEKCKALEAKIESWNKVESIFYADEAEPFLQVIKDAGKGDNPEIKKLRGTMDDFYRIDNDILYGTEKSKDAKQKIASTEEDIGAEPIHQKKRQLELENKEIKVKLSNTPDNKEREINISNSIDGISKLLDTFAHRLDGYKKEYKSAEQKLSKNDIPPEDKKSHTNDIDQSLHIIISCRDIVRTLAERLDKEIEGKIEEQRSRYDQIIDVIGKQLGIIRKENGDLQAKLIERLESLN